MTLLGLQRMSDFVSTEDDGNEMKILFDFLSFPAIFEDFQNKNQTKKKKELDLNRKI